MKKTTHQPSTFAITQQCCGPRIPLSHFLVATCILCFGILFGCRGPLANLSDSSFPAVPVPNKPVADRMQIDNPLLISVQDHAFAWGQLTDELETYFRIRREERVHVVGNVVTEGWLETLPTTGSSIFEPWKKDSARGFEKWQSTFQTIRKWARVRVIPADGGYWFDVQVYKELEDLDHPQNSTVGSAIKRHDNSREREDFQGEFSAGDYGWIPIGRDVELEQRILDHLRSRLTDPQPENEPARYPFLRRIFARD
jgi:hypothetical protein